MSIYFDVSSKLPFVYVEMGRLRIRASSFSYVNEKENFTIPAGRFSALFIGPGVSITDKAVRYCIASGCIIAWVGEDITKCFCTTPTLSQSSANFIKQVEFYTKGKKELLRRYYEIRFEKPLLGWSRITPEKMRGVEGAYMKKVYIACAKKYGIPYIGRMRESDWDKNTIYNKGISTCNSFLYGMCCAVITAMGYSTALGILHTGDMRSLVFDIADIYKIRYSIPLGFEVAHDLQKGLFTVERVEAEIRKRALLKAKEMHLLSVIVKDVGVLFDGNISNKEFERQNQEISLGVSL